MDIMDIGLIVAGVTFAGVVAIQTRKKKGLGIGKFGGSCPKCSTPLPKARIPRDFREMFFGGWTCQSCATKVDKYGRIRET